mgnify:CR=1 FL=1
MAKAPSSCGEVRGGTLKAKFGQTELRSCVVRIKEYLCDLRKLNSYLLCSISHKNVLPILAADVSQNSILLADTLSYSLWELLNENPDELSKPNYLKIAIDIGEGMLYQTPKVRKRRVLNRVLGLAHLHTAIPPIYAQNVNSKNILVRYIRLMP